MIDIRNIQDFNNYLDTLLNQTECDDIEFKSAAGGFPSSFWETYSAFANTDGGTIVFGVKETNGKFSLNGLSEEQIEKYKKDFWNGVNNPSTISCNLMNENNVRDAEYKGYRFLLFFIPRASKDQRPVFKTTDPYNGTYKRNYEGDYKCSKKEVRRMFADADEQHPADSRILKNYTMDDIDMETIRAYRQKFSISSPDHPWLILNDIDLLKKLGGYRKDRETGEEGFTVAGLLMFGKSESITDIECTPNFFPDYREHLTEDENVRWTNRICSDGTWEANLFNFYQRVLPRLQSVLPKPFKLEGNIRKEETPAHVAVREALINLCVHADYTEDASLVVKHNTNAFIFSNPGTMLVSKEQYYSGGESVCRNKSLQKMFSMLGVAEKAGSGTDKILKGWKESNWRAPIINEHQNPDKVELIMPMESLLSENTKLRLEEKFGRVAGTFEHDVLSILALTCDEGSVTNERLRYSLNLHKREISVLLKQMCQSGLLVAQGYGRGTRYLLPENINNNLFTSIEQSQEDIISSNSEVSLKVIGEPMDNNRGTSDDYRGTSDDYRGTSDDYRGTSDDYRGTSDDNNINPHKKRLSKKQMDLLVISICQDWMDKEEIAQRLHRKVKYVSDVILPRLIKEKQLEMLYPGTPNHPRQKYKIKD